MQSYYQHNSSRSRSSNPLNRCFQPLQMPSNNPASSQLSASTAGRAVVTAPIPSSSSASSSRRFRGVPGGEMQIQWPSSPASFRGMSTWDPNGILILSLFLGSKWLEFLWFSDLSTMIKHDHGVVHGVDSSRIFYKVVLTNDFLVAKQFLRHPPSSFPPGGAVIAT